MKNAEHGFKLNNSKMGNQIYFKIAGWVDLDMLNIFAV